MKRRGRLVPIPAGQLISGRPDPAGTGQQGRKQEMEKKPGGRGWRQELAERLLGKLATRQGMRRTLPQAQEDSCRKAGAGSRLDGEKDAGSFPGKPCLPPDGVLTKAPTLDPWRLVHEAKGIGNLFFAG